MEMERSGMEVRYVYVHTSAYIRFNVLTKMHIVPFGPVFLRLMLA